MEIRHALFSEMIKKRNHDWWKGGKNIPEKFLSNSNVIAYSLLVREILPKLRTLSNEAKQYIHFRYTDATGQFDPVYDTGLVFTGKIDDYLGSMWQGKMGVV